MANKSYWQEQFQSPPYSRLDRDLKVDVAIIGGGLMGITAAYLLKKAGRTVALLDRYRCGSGDTSHTTAHLTYVTDERFHKLVSHFGPDHAQAAWDAGRAAIHQIQDIVKEENIHCDLTWIPGFLHAPIVASGVNESDKLSKDAQLASELGFDAHFEEVVPLVGTAGVCFANQAKFHPLKYLSQLLERIADSKNYVFENSEVAEVQDKPLSVKANGFTVSCDYVIVATHVPIVGKASFLSATLLQSKLALYSSYVLGAKIRKGIVPEALFWDTSDPYYYLRVDSKDRYDYVIFGGEDHKTGQEKDTEAPFRKLEDALVKYLPDAEVVDRWSGQVVETHDGLPFIGETTDRQFVGTGFAGNGMTFGTLSAMMACDAALGRNNPWRDLFDVHRKKVLGGAWDYLKENVDYPYYYLKDRLLAAEGKSLESLPRGEGKILKINGQRVAAYRDSAGKVSSVSPFCTHMGCIVHWNQAEKTWDCPCHGSRFQPNGEVIGGPAESPLEEVSIKQGVPQQAGRS